MKENIWKNWRNNFPDGWEFDGRALTYKGNYVSNFIPCVAALHRIRSLDQDREEDIVVFYAIFPQDYQVKQEIRFDSLRKLDFQLDIDVRCYVNAEARKYLIDLMLFQISQVACGREKTIYLSEKLGYVHLPNGEIIYNAGNRILGRTEAKVISSEKLQKYNLAVDPVMEDGSLERKIWDMIHLRPNLTEILFAYVVLSLLREPFRRAGVPIRFCMYLLGENQSFKTTLATNFCSLYNRDEDIEQWIHNLTGSEARLLEVLDVEKDCVSIIDDLNHSDSVSQERQQEAKISTLIRSAANNVGKETMKKQLDINAQVLFCGEYPLKNISTNNRLIVLILEKDMIDRKKLSDIQRVPLVLSTFAERFIYWVIDNYDDICEKIKRYYQDFLENRANEDGYQDRINRSAGILGTAYRMFLLFCENCGWSMELDMMQFNVSLENALAKQIEYLRLESQEAPDYIAFMYDAYMTEYNFENVMEKRPDGFWKKQIFYDKKSGLIYILNHKWEKMVSSCFSNAVKLSDVTQKFEEAGILCVDKNKNHTRTKKLAGKRCYVFDFKAWRDYIEDLVYTQQNGRIN